MSRKRNRTSKTNIAAESSGQDLPIAESQVSREKSTINYFKWIGLLVAFFSAWTPFFGYGYLKGQLEGLGFPNVQLETSVQEMVLAFFKGVAPSLVTSIEQFGDFLIGAAVASLLGGIVVTFALVSNEEDQSASPSTEWRWAKRLRKLAKDAKSSLWSKVKLGVFLSSAIFFGEFLVGLLFVAFLLHVWFIGVGGYSAGRDAGEKMHDEPSCFQKVDAVCTTTTINGSSVPVEVLHSDNRYQYVATCEGIYQLDAQNTVHLFKPWTNRCAGSKADAG